MQNSCITLKEIYGKFSYAHGIISEKKSDVENCTNCKINRRYAVCNALRKSFLLLEVFLIIFLFLSYSKASAQQIDKVQNTVNSLKQIYDNQNDDYITDGQRVVWVKSYKKWMPDDLAILKKEASNVFIFFSQAVQHSRYDVLEQLLPDYYQDHGGVQAFARDILKQSAVMQANTATKTHTH